MRIPLRKRMQKSLRDRLAVVEQKVAEKVADIVRQLSGEVIARELESVKSYSGLPALAAARDMLQKLTANKLSSYQQEIEASTLEKVSEAFSESLENLEEQILKVKPEEIAQLQSMLYPYGTRLVIRNPETTIFVIEQKPQVRTIRYLDQNYCLGFPFLLFVQGWSRKGEHRGTSVYYATRHLTALDHILFACNLTNIRSDNSVCMSPKIPNSCKSLSDKAEAVLDHFWQSGFNDSATPAFDSMRSRDPRLGSFHAWEKATEKDPLFVLNVEWNPVGTLQSVLGKLVESAKKPTGEVLLRTILNKSVITPMSTAMRRHWIGLPEVPAYTELEVKLLAEHLMQTKKELAKIVMDPVFQLRDSSLSNVLDLMSAAMIEVSDGALRDNFARSKKNRRRH